jgi:hypothetical protein
MTYWKFEHKKARARGRPCVSARDRRLTTQANDSGPAVGHWKIILGQDSLGRESTGTETLFQENIASIYGS